MWRFFLCIVLHIAYCCSKAQPVRNPADTTRLLGWMEEAAQPLPVLVLNENARTEDAGVFLPSLLHANRDILVSAAAFHFGFLRFRLRGYDSEWSGTSINGIRMNNPEDGNTPWAYWAGLNDVTRNVQVQAFLQPWENGFGGIGVNTAIDVRAMRQRVQTQIGYAFSNRSYTHRLSLTHARGFNRRGWSFAGSLGCRYAAQGYVPGTYLNGFSYYIAADKKIGADAVFSISVFGNASENGKQSAATLEAAALSGSPYYNSYWGYQNGKPRNANTGFTHVPVLLLNYERRISNQESWYGSLALMYGRKTATALDWYDAADPRPDYYRNLPSYYKDSALRDAVEAEYREQPGRLQLDWQKLYTVNRSSFETITGADGISGNQVSGLRSHYILEERVTDIRRIDGACQYQFRWKEQWVLTGGIAVQWQQQHCYKRVADLLGGEFYVNWNQFAEGDATVIQNDLDHPDRIVRKGDQYGYDYLMVHGGGNAWAQAMFTGRKWDAFIAARTGYRFYFRQGLVRTGLFPEESLGRSEVFEYGEYACRAGISYKIDGRRYAELAVISMNSAPAADNVLISPRTRNTAQEEIAMQQVLGAEISYHVRSPKWKLRATLYVTRFAKGMNVLGFYHDGYRSFVNYAMRNINRLHSGAEIGIERELGSRWTLTGAVSAGRFVYTGRPEITVSADNDAYVLERGTVYAAGYPVGGTPQQAYMTAVAYRSDKGLYLSLAASYFREHWLEINPLRRTPSALNSLAYGTDAWKQALAPQQLPEQYSVDVSAGRSFRLKQQKARPVTLMVFLNISNLLNQKNMRSGGYEQLRFDAANPERFPPKFFHAMGLNGSLTLSLRF